MFAAGKVKSWHWRNSEWVAFGPADYARSFLVQVGPYYMGVPWPFGTLKRREKKAAE